MFSYCEMGTVVIAKFALLLHFSSTMFFSGLLFRSQALRETKTLKWLVESYDDDGKEEANKKKVVRNKDVVCPFCKEKGHKTRIAKACLRHHEWLDINSSSSTKEAMSGIQNTGTDNKGSMLVV